MKDAWDDILDVIRPKWPSEWSRDPATWTAVSQLVDDARGGRPSSLPVVQSTARRISWLTVAASLRELREYLDDLRVWLPKAEGSTISGQVTVPSDSGPLGPALRVIVPHGYVRWDTAIDRGRDILRRLHRMHVFLSTRPRLAEARVPSGAALRLEFITSLKVGDWFRARQCIDEIDQWSLEPASATLQMRIRLLEARGDRDELFAFVNRHEAWNFANPRKIAAAIVSAIDAGAIQPVERSDGLQRAYEVFRQTWHQRLVHLISDARVESQAVRLAAFAATADADRHSLGQLLPLLPEAVSAFLSSQLPVETPSAPGHHSSLVDTPSSSTVVTDVDPDQPPTVAPTPSCALPSDVGSYWRELHRAIGGANVARTRALIDALESDLVGSAEFIASAPDEVLELLTDPAIDLRHEAKTLRYEALAALVDCFIGAPRFPDLTCLEIYLSLLNGIVELRGGAANDADSQLVLGLGGAVANLSPPACVRCEEAFRALWHRRPIVHRLDWLTAALDTLAELHPSPHNLIDLFTDGLALAARKGVVMSPTRVAVWRQIGAMLELPGEDVDELLKPVEGDESGDRVDVLASTGVRTIAIVSLREASAKSAARELEARTGANVLVTSSLVADDDTRHAATADLILYVWAASTHATYRAFDRWRDKVEYVQGTGAASIMMAAERWAARRRSQTTGGDNISTN